MPAKRTLYIALGIAVSLIALAAGIVYLYAQGIVTPTQAKLMLAELLGLYIGFGVLIAVYRFMRDLD
jgi:hypothetical protein